MSNELDLFFDQLTAPLSSIQAQEAVIQEDVALLEETSCLPPAEDSVVELIAGHFIAEHDTQVSFFEKSTVGVADRSILESILGEPVHVLPSQRYLLCGRHYLVIDNIIDPPHRWAELLIDNRIFVPWPDILAADLFHFTTPASVMIQPDRYIAGMILSYYIARHGAEAVELVS